MENNIKKGFIAKGTTCKSCEEIVKKQALKINGVKQVEFDYSTQEGYVIFNKNKTNIDEILSKIEEKGYECFILKNNSKNKKSMGLILGILGMLVVGYFLIQFIEKINMPQISPNMGYGLLFIVGILTGFHCISMCGGFVLSYTAKNAKQNKKSHTSHLMYGLGKIASYTIIGAIFGLIGSIIAFTPLMRGIAGIIAGLFLILFGLKIFNIFPFLRKVNIKTPKFLMKFVGKKSHENSSPLILGLLNGLMIACGPLQAIYIMAAGTGSMIEGAKLLFIFGIGTLPAIIGFGYFASFISNKATQKILKASSIIIIILGVIMINNGFVLTGTGYDVGSITTKNIQGNNLDSQLENVAVQKDGYQEIKMDVLSSGWGPDKFVLKKGVPLRWIINGMEINGCNNAIQVPKYGLEFDIKQGEQVIEFTPTQEGVVKWSCWMGMIPGTFIVTDNIEDTAKIENELNNIEIPVLGGCGCGWCGVR
jgi:sulfite exporter TauE/SafE/copper chaperone CopZ